MIGKKGGRRNMKKIEYEEFIKINGGMKSMVVLESTFKNDKKHLDRIVIHSGLLGSDYPSRFRK